MTTVENPHTFESIARHNAQMVAKYMVPEAALRGVRRATEYTASYIIEIQARERAGGGVYLLVFTSYRPDAERADHCWIVGPRGKATRAY
jgi:hypothetical protein